MAHNLFGERFIGARSPAWHKLGTVFTEPLTAVEAIERAHLDYAIAKAPLTAQFAGNALPTDQFALVRAPTSDDATARVLGIVGADYQFLTNRELAELADRELTKHLPVETAGALGHGETFFLCLDAGMTELVPGETLHNYFLLTDTRDGTSALQIAYTPVRVVCQNTLNSGLGKATVKWSIGHVGRHRQNVESDAQLVGAIHAAQATVTEQMRRLTETRITIEQVDAVLATCYPEPSVPAILRRAQSLDQFGIKLDGSAQGYADTLTRRLLTERERIVSYRTGAKGLYATFNDQFPNVAATPWAIYNAVVETEDYREGTGDIDRAVLFGDRALRKAGAFRAATALVN